MSIKESNEKRKLFFKGRNFFRKAFTLKLYIASILVLVATASFGIGRLSVLSIDQKPVIFYPPPPLTSEEGSVSGHELYVASRHGSYYYGVWCDATAHLSRQNKVFFNSQNEAKKEGYNSHTACAGLY